MFKSGHKGSWYTILLIHLVLQTSVTASASAEDKKVYPDLASYRADLTGCVVEERQLDINDDGDIDVLVFSTGGEETYLDILVKKEAKFFVIDVPVAADYEIQGFPGHYELRVGHGTFPTYGNPYGSDKYLWYDFYAVIGHSLELRNSGHAEFYKWMVPQYQKRIAELEKEIMSLKEEQNKVGSDPEILKTLIGFRRKHIERYKHFIQRAEDIVRTQRRP